MQLCLPLEDRAGAIIAIHSRLRRHLPPPGSFLALDPVSQLVNAMIGGVTQDAVSKDAFLRLRRRFGSWEAVRDAPEFEVRKMIRAVTHADQKAGRIKKALATITGPDGRCSLDRLSVMSDTEALLWLERLHGVGRKSSATVLNFSTLRRPVLVIDTHHLRILRRLGLIGRRDDTRNAYERIMPLAPDNWRAAEFDEHHQFVKLLGQTICRPKQPKCNVCPLADLCPSAGHRRRNEARSSAIIQSKVGPGRTGWRPPG